MTRLKLHEWSRLVQDILWAIHREEQELRRTHQRPRRKRKLMRLRMKCMGIIHLHRQMVSPGAP